MGQNGTSWAILGHIGTNHIESAGRTCCDWFAGRASEYLPGEKNAMKTTSRRKFLRQAAAIPLLSGDWLPVLRKKDYFFKISRAQWSLHRVNGAGGLVVVDLASVARNEYDVIHQVKGFHLCFGINQLPIPTFRQSITSSSIRRTPCLSPRPRGGAPGIMPSAKGRQRSIWGV